MSNRELQAAKSLVRDFHAAFDAASDSDLTRVLSDHVATDYLWRGMHPFYEQQGASAVADVFWLPLRRSFKSLQRREDVFMAGFNDAQANDALWVAGMGNMMGLFDEAWLGIPPTGKLAFLRYAEFHRIEDGAIAESAFFCDVISVMQQAGQFPFSGQTGAAILQPGPRTHDGILLETQPEAEGRKTLDLLNTMIADLKILNRSDDDFCPPEVLEKSWHDNMLWFGPSGIGATYTIPRYQEQHQRPFRTQLKDKVFNGHIARFAEGNYAGFFGWANLTNTPTGGFLGLPGNDTRADMRVVDIYRREGDKLAENWVFIDLLHWLSMQGLDVLGRMRSLLP